MRMWEYDIPLPSLNFSYPPFYPYTYSMKKDPSPLTFIDVDSTWRIGIVAAAYYKEETDALVQSAKETLLEAGIPDDQISEWSAPGSFEIPLIGECLAAAHEVDALIGIGIIVQGQTKHADLLAQESARGIMDVSLRHGIPFAFEVLWVNDLQEARERSEKGREAAIAVLHSLAEKARIHS